MLKIKTVHWEKNVGHQLEYYLQYIIDQCAYCHTDEYYGLSQAVFLLALHLSLTLTLATLKFFNILFNRGEVLTFSSGVEILEESFGKDSLELLITVLQEQAIMWFAMGCNNRMADMQLLDRAASTTDEALSRVKTKLSRQALTRHR